MTHAELLRRDAELAMREGGMYYSGEYLSRMAIIAESLEAENAKLRELCKAWRKFARELFDEYIGEPEADDDFMELDDRMRELEVEGDG